MVNMGLGLESWLRLVNMGVVAAGGFSSVGLGEGFFGFPSAETSWTFTSVRPSWVWHLLGALAFYIGQTFLDSGVVW